MQNVNINKTTYLERNEKKKKKARFFFCEKK